MFYRNGAVDLQLCSDDFDRAFIASAAVLIVTGTALAADPSRAAAIQALETARAREYIRHSRHRSPAGVLAIGCRSQSHIYGCRPAADAVVGNDEEFAVIAGSAKDALAAAADLAKRGCKFTIFKQGRHGSITLTRDRSFETGIFPVEVKKPFGAGDAFMGGLVASLLAGGSLELAVQRASAAAAYVVSRRGCAFAMPSKAELDLFIESHSLTRELAHAHSTLR